MAAAAAAGYRSDSLFDYRLGDAAEEDADGGAAAAAAAAGGGSLERKRRELQDATDERIGALEAQVRERDAELARQQETLATLTKDFEYNVELIKERDEELERFEEASATLRLAVEERDREAVTLRAALQAAKERTEREQERAASVETHYQEQLLQFKSERETLRRSAQEEKDEREEVIRTLRCDLERQRAELFQEAGERIETRLAGFTAQAAEAAERDAAHRAREESLQQLLQQRADQLTAASAALSAAEAQLSPLRAAAADADRRAAAAEAAADALRASA
eukprot:Rhum_TRINITY_DN19701_c0_g1::Rhum_TRINITY_DN19701_c0_g1_i1::g.170440::m.170440